MPGRASLIIAGLAALGLSPTSAAARPLDRPDDPMVLTGAELPKLEGIDPSKLVAFRWSGGWHQVPVQVDERAMVDLGIPYRQTPVGLSVLTYTDPNTLVGPDPDPSLDDDDEVAAMAADAGERRESRRAPVGTVARSGVEVRVSDPLKPRDVGFIYLFRGNGSLRQGAGHAYVHYDFRLDSGDYLATYRTSSGPNPEDSTVRTPVYSQHFSDRWVDDAIELHTGGATGVDILDRHKSMFAPGNCARSEDTFSAGEGAFLVNRSGPVRAIRTYIGANSGPYSEREHIFYRSREDITSYLRVHPIGSLADFLDYSPAAAGMTYRNNLNPGGVTIDGTPDSPVPGVPVWEQVSGPQGGLTIVNSLQADIAPTVTSYYFDQAHPGSGSETQCTGDSSAFGSSGPYITSPIPNTDPTRGPAASLSVTKHLYFAGPGVDAAGAQEHADQIAAPLRTGERPLRLRRR